MGTAPNGYNTPKTNWAAGNVPTASDFNRIEGNIQAIEENLRTIDPAQAPSSNQGSLRQFLDWFANRIKVITGKTNWYDAPSKTLEDLNTHINAAAPHSGHALLGTSNQEINFFKALNQQIDTRSIALVYANGRLTTVVKKDGETIIKTVSLSYDTDGKLTHVQEVVGGKTITITLNYDANGILTAVTRSVV